MSAPRVYVLLGEPPGCRSVGAIFMRDCLTWLPQEHVACGVVGPVVGTEGNLECLPWLNKTLVRVPPGPRHGAPHDPIARVRRWRHWRHMLGAFTTEAVEQLAVHAEAHRPDLLVALLDHRLLFGIAHRLRERLGVPMSAMVWDAPEWLIRDAGCSRWAYRLMMEHFRTSLTASDRVGVISEAMGEEYAQRYHVDPLILRHGYPREAWFPVRSELHRPGELKLGLAGKLYGIDAWEALTAALDASDWRIGGRRLCVRLVGGFCPQVARGRSHFEVYGWRPRMEAIGLMAECDLAYLPYWFAEGLRDVARLSFSGKIAGYLAAGTPVFFHGPEYAAPTRFLAERGIGASCHSRDPSAILDALGRLIEPEVYSRAAQAVERARGEDLGAHVMRRRFAQLIGCTETDLRPPSGPVCDCDIDDHGRS